MQKLAFNRWYRLSHIAIVTCFLIGVVRSLEPAIVIGGVAMVGEDVWEMGEGTLNPALPIFLAIVLIWLIEPWYLGVFWASAAFHFLNIPGDFLVLFSRKPTGAV